MFPFRGVCLIHTSHQNLVILPSPTLICKFASNLGHKFLIALQTPAPQASMLTLLHQNPSSPYLHLIKSFHKACLSSVSPQPFHQKTVVMLPQITDAQATFIFSMQNCHPLDQIVPFVLFAAMPKEISPKFVQFLSHFCRYSEKRRTYVGRESRTELIRMCLPPKEMY